MNKYDRLEEITKLVNKSKERLGQIEIVEELNVSDMSDGDLKAF